ncbi:hypothetical protein AAES_78368 [Amazona aestiva]|uniref:Uncharacterized protein n=1 Tax=Amazona aestiva TaxID=12930 RepID=A0A0Q3PKZ5_AMAAE|nr:hypothetical protein AAES_78368 [Amazona aestiva]
MVQPRSVRIHANKEKQKRLDYETNCGSNQAEESFYQNEIETFSTSFWKDTYPDQPIAHPPECCQEMQKLQF